MNNTVKGFFYLPGQIFLLNFCLQNLKQLKVFNFRKKMAIKLLSNPNKNNMSHLDALRRNLNLYSTQYEHLTLMEDFDIDSK